VGDGNNHTNVVATVFDMKCEEDKCAYIFTYSIQNKSYASAYIDSSPIAKHTKGDSVNIVVDTRNPAVIQFIDSQNTVNNVKLGWILIGFGIGLLVLSLGTYWLTRRYKAFAAYTGGSGLLNGIFRR